jgi:type IV secretory pathway protease TraF
MTRKRILAVTAAGVTMMALSLREPIPRLVWNASPSVPLGFYHIAPSSVRRGELVLARLPPKVADFTDRRGYLQRTAFLLKTVVASAGDRVCRFGAWIVVHGAFAARALPRDKRGRRLPVWRGCLRLASGATTRTVSTAATLA